MVYVCVCPYMCVRMCVSGCALCILLVLGVTVSCFLGAKVLKQVTRLIEFSFFISLFLASLSRFSVSLSLSCACLSTLYTYSTRMYAQCLPVSFTEHTGTFSVPFRHSKPNTPMEHTLHIYLSLVLSHLSLVFLTRNGEAFFVRLHPLMISIAWWWERLMRTSTLGRESSSESMRKTRWKWKLKKEKKGSLHLWEVNMLDLSVSRILLTRPLECYRTACAKAQTKVCQIIATQT